MTSDYEFFSYKGSRSSGEAMKDSGSSWEQRQCKYPLLCLAVRSAAVFYCFFGGGGLLMWLAVLVCVLWAASEARDLVRLAQNSERKRSLVRTSAVTHTQN